MRIDWRISASVAGLAFIIAALSAGLGGVPFGQLLFRAILGAVIFGVLGSGVQLLIDRYLPELASGREAVAEPRPGGKVDIVVSDDEDAAEAIPEYESPPDQAEGLREQFGSYSEEDDSESSGLDSFEESLVEEAREVSLPPSDSAEEERSEPETSVPADVDGENLDKLPDVEGFADSFSEDSGVESVTYSADPENSGDEGHQDPATIAKALQTMMKRDQ